MFRSNVAVVLLGVARQSEEAILKAIHRMLRELPAKRDPGNRLQELAWLLFLNDDDRDDGDPCFCASVRRELRGLRPARRKLWVALLKLASAARTPDAKWDEKVKRALDRIGREDWDPHSDMA
jgi:hypothetical protein